MSVDIYLYPSSASPLGPAAQAAMGRALAVCGARWGKDGEDEIVLASGAGVWFYGPDDDDAGGSFCFHGRDPKVIYLDAEAVEMVFQVAEATACFIVAPGWSPQLLRTPGNTGEPPSDDPVWAQRVAPVTGVDDLVVRFGKPVSKDVAEIAAQAGAAEDLPDEDLPEPDPTLLDRFFKRSKQD